jgi:hypothetical protein
MGFLSKMFGHIKDLNRLSFSIGNMIIMLDKYDSTEDTALLYMAAWLSKAGVHDTLQKGNVEISHSLHIMMDYSMQEIRVHEALTRSVGRLKAVISTLEDPLHDRIVDIMEGGESFITFDRTLSEDQKKHLLKAYIN